jgi:hypothetical protein
MILIPRQNRKDFHPKKELSKQKRSKYFEVSLFADFQCNISIEDKTVSLALQEPCNAWHPPSMELSPG